MSVEHPILVFDGDCMLCSRSVQFVLRHDRKKRFLFSTTQSPAGANLMAEHGIDAAKPASVLLIEHDRTYTESAALIRILGGFGGAWPLVAALLWIVPKPLRDSVYRAIAQRRYRWFGRRESCYLPDSSEAGRFLHD